MSIEVVPGGPVRVARCIEDLKTTWDVRTDSFIVRGALWLLEEGEPLETVLKVVGYEDGCAGQISSRMITSGMDEVVIVMVTKDDAQLWSEERVREIVLGNTRLIAR